MVSEEGSGVLGLRVLIYVSECSTCVPKYPRIVSKGDRNWMVIQSVHSFYSFFDFQFSIYIKKEKKKGGTEYM